MTEMIAKPQFMVIFIAISLASQSVESLVRVPRNSDSGRFASFVDVGSTVFYQGICLVAETTQIKMQCSSSDRIKILRTVYGYNPGYSSMTNTPSPDSCAFSVTDCSFDREFTIDNECTGRNSCLMTIRKSRVLNESLFYHQTCKDFNYVQVNYQCLPNLPTKDVCGASKARLSHAYLMTPNFPAPINAGASCECTLSTSYEKGQILLRRIDMKLPGGNDNVNCGETYLEINENEVGVERKCGYERETGSIFGSGAKSLKLNFVTSQSETQRLAQGFWLEVMASPPSENHMIEIVCNPGVYTQQLSNFDILNKLKEIHEKIKRLNKTYLDPKFGRVLNNRTQLFLDKNARKFLNMTNSFSRKITTQKDGEEDSPRSTTLGYKQQKSTSAALAAMRDLELEIEKFFSSNDVQLASQIDEVERKNNNNNNKAFKSKTDSRPSKTKYNDHRLIDLLAIAKSRNGAKKVSTTTKTDKTKSSPTNDEEEDEPKTTKDREQEEIEELTQNENEAIKKEESDKDEESIPSRSRSRQESNNAESDPNKLIEQLEQLNEELDMGEKLLKHKADPTVLNDTKISDSLAVLLGQTPTPSTHNQAAEHLNVVYANAQRQDFKHSFDSQHHQQQSNVTAVFVGLGVSIAFIALVINAAMCYSCYRKGDSMQRYREALADRSSRFQSSMRQSIDSLNLESVRSLVQDVPRRLREYLIRKLTAGGNIDSTNNSSRSNKRSSGQHGNQSGNEPYDDYNATQGGAGDYGASAGGVSLSSKSEASFSNEEPCIYNSGGESEYNASMLSDSASMAEMKAASGSATPPPPPPPPPCPPPPPPAEQQHRSNTHKSKKSSAIRCEDVAANDEVECVNEEETSKSHKKSSKSHHHHHHKNSSHSRRL